MRSIELPELKVLQMDILNVVHEFCQQNGIQYSLGCGTLLGAIRHKGYIPWDDDIDIYVLRDDYNKLLSLFPQYLNNIRIVSIERDSKWVKPYAKAYDDRTICDEGGKLDNIGVSIDIFPIDAVPFKENDWLSFNRKRRFLHHLYEAKFESFSRNRALYRNIALGLSKAIVLFASPRKVCEYFDRFVQKYNKIDSTYVFESCQGMLQKNRFKKSNMESFIDLPFEDRVYKGMKEFDEYLTNGFGDYMKLPPEEKRVSHHDIKAWWKE